MRGPSDRHVSAVPAGLSREILAFSTNTWRVRASRTCRMSALRSFSRKFERVHLAPLAGGLSGKKVARSSLFLTSPRARQGNRI
jgi:hypothetical protein